MERIRCSNEKGKQKNKKRMHNIKRNQPLPPTKARFSTSLQEREKELNEKEKENKRRKSFIPTSLVPFVLI
jgi:hypothetical protein